ncbi:hypothetical protein SKAU_G00317820 [Synaphobranchus kaupii]|uniref:Uncharacterized protein n=1 Tax=Synaphobranchus kaupii TaxID=118154 RepID=A0A9Q1ESX4_SYNKA|nr:hypothetical protein SKAU_G00317820 [Synaphobranchus kaupii]
MLLSHLERGARGNTSRSAETIAPMASGTRNNNNERDTLSLRAARGQDGRDSVCFHAPPAQACTDPAPVYTPRDRADRTAGVSVALRYPCTTPSGGWQVGADLQAADKEQVYLICLHCCLG